MNRARLACLDGVRGLMAAYVMASHAVPFADSPAWIRSLLSHGQAAVDVFFVLSGLVILMSWEAHGRRAAPFLRARARRILPLYLLVLAASLPIRLIPCPTALLPWAGRAAAQICDSGWPNHGWFHVVLHLFMAHGILPDAALPDAWSAFLGPAWSLSTEWQFYAVVALIGRGRTRSADQLAWFLVVVLLGMAAAGIAWERALPEAWRFSRAFLPNKAHYFALGVASAAWLAQGRAMTGWRLTLAATLAICAAREPSAGKLLPPLIWTLCLLAQRGSLPVLAGLLSARPMLLLGGWSYGIYLINEPAQKLLAALLAPAAAGDGSWFTLRWLPVSLLLPVLLAAALHPWERRMARGERQIGSTTSNRARSMPSLPSSV